MPFSTRHQKFPEIQCGIFRRIESVLGSITRRCSRKKPAFRGTKTGYERATEIEPKSAQYQDKLASLAGVIQIISNCRSSLKHFNLVGFRVMLSCVSSFWFVQAGVYPNTLFLKKYQRASVSLRESKQTTWNKSFIIDALLCLYAPRNCAVSYHVSL